MENYQQHPLDDDKRKRSPASDPREAECLICGATQYTWGKLGSSGGVYFLEQGTIFGFGMGQPLEARKCNICGNVQIFSK